MVNECLYRKKFHVINKSVIIVLAKDSKNNTLQHSDIEDEERSVNLDVLESVAVI